MHTPPTVGRMGKLPVLKNSFVFCNQVLKDEDSPCIKARLWDKHKLPQMKGLIWRQSCLPWELCSVLQSLSAALSTGAPVF